jgi:serine/threonine protein phosphatase PrpC
MPTVYAGLNTLHSKAEVSCFKLKGEDFHTKQCQVEVDGIINGCKTSTTIAIFAVFDGHGGKRAADFANKQVCELHGVGVQMSGGSHIVLKSMHTMKAKVARVNRQILHPNFPCSVLFIPNFTSSF